MEDQVMEEVEVERGGDDVMQVVTEVEELMTEE